MRHYKMILANQKTVETSDKEIKEFITIEGPKPNSYWRYSELLKEDEVMRVLKGEANEEDLKKAARYILIFQENLAFTAHLFDKGDGTPGQTKEFNMPVLVKLREIYKKVINETLSLQELGDLVISMENACMEVGADPL